MSNINQTFFDALLDVKAAKWSAGVSFDRSNPLPLDQWSVFKDKAAAIEYLSNAKAYPGQFIAYADDNGIMIPCILTQNADGAALELKYFSLDTNDTIEFFGGKAPQEEEL